ncbi:phosphotransferase [Phyllobacterium sp. TAF24]|uniref:phosphotransferase n=1 Tax=Phyllobacterium sp. TAF24 TaxID=3233068 RepID=UPI003F9CF82D
MQGKLLGQAVTASERALEAVLLEISEWQSEHISYAPVLGGISNTNWQIRINGHEIPYFLKMPGQGTEMFIDRQAALEASRRAEEIGIGPKGYPYLAHKGIEITDFIEDRRSCTNKDFRDVEIRNAAIGAYRQFHNAGQLGLTKTVFDMIEEHIDQARTLNGFFPQDFDWLYTQYRMARSALEASGIDLVACFNDPMPGNFMVDEAKTIMLIDYEYASNNDRCYDLGIWCGEMFFSNTIENEVIEEYFGHFDPQMYARLYVHKALADIKWSTWAMVQREVSALDFDFHKYGAWKHMRARSYMRDPRWKDYLKIV